MSGEDMRPLGLLRGGPSGRVTLLDLLTPAGAAARGQGGVGGGLGGWGGAVHLDLNQPSKHCSAVKRTGGWYLLVLHGNSAVRGNRVRRTRRASHRACVFSRPLSEFLCILEVARTRWPKRGWLPQRRPTTEIFGFLF